MSQINKIIKKEPPSVFHSAFVMAMGTFSSRLVALVREMILAAYFPRFITDIWIVSLRIPNLCRRLLGEGSLSVAFIPVFVELLENKSPSVAQKLVNIVFSVILVLLLTFFMLGLIFTPQIVHLLTAGDAFAQIENKVKFTIYFTRIMMVFLILVCMYAFFMSIQNSFKRFAIPAFAPVLFNLTIVIAAFLPSTLFDIPGEVLAWAVVVGGVLQLCVVIPGVWSLGYLPQVQWNFVKGLQFKPARRVLSRLFPSLIGAGVLQLTVLVNTYFASYLQEGANSWIFWADRLLEFPLSLIAISMGTALLPTLSQNFAQGRLDKILILINQSLRYMLFLGIPAGVALFLLSELLVQVIFQRGYFGNEDVEYTAAVLRIYGMGIFAYGGIRILQPAFYAIQNTWIPALVSATCLIFHVLLASHLLESYGIEGLAFSSIVSGSLNLCLLLFFYRFFIGSLGYSKIISSVVYIVVASFVMAIGLQFILDQFLLENAWDRFFLLCLLCPLGFSLYMVTSFYLGSQEAIDFFDKVRSLINKKL